MINHAELYLIRYVLFLPFYTALIKFYHVILIYLIPEATIPTAKTMMNVTRIIINYSVFTYIHKKIKIKPANPSFELAPSLSFKQDATNSVGQHM